jgi:hypothetical protein
MFGGISSTWNLHKEVLYHHAKFGRIRWNDVEIHKDQNQTHNYWYNIRVIDWHWDGYLTSYVGNSVVSFALEHSPEAYAFYHVRCSDIPVYHLSLTLSLSW